VKHRRIQFSVLLRGERPIVLGYLPWPWAIVDTYMTKDLLVVEDEKETSVVCLKDLSLNDLELT
jgi:hypothetical protein